MSEPDIIPPKGPPRASQQPALSGLRLRPGKHALSENPIIFGAVQYARLNLKRVIPRPVVEFIRRLLSPRASSSAPPDSAPREPQRNPSFDWLDPFFASVGLDGEPSAIFAALRAAGYPVYDTRLPDREMDLGRNGSVQVRPPNTVLGYATRVDCAPEGGRIEP